MAKDDKTKETKNITPEKGKPDVAKESAPKPEETKAIDKGEAKSESKFKTMFNNKVKSKDKFDAAVKKSQEEMSRKMDESGVSESVDAVSKKLEEKTSAWKKQIEEKSNTLGKDVKEQSEVARQKITEQSRKIRDKVQEKYVSGTALEKPVGTVNRAVGFMTDGAGGDMETATKYAKRPIQVGMWAVLLLIVVPVLWGLFADLSSSAVASGTVVLNDNKKTVQHPEGGIIAELLVREGDTVERGQPLVRMEETNARARMEIFKGQYNAARAMEARLIAERDDLEEIPFPNDILSKQSEDPDLAKIIDAQERIFETRKRAYHGQIDVLQQRIKQLKDEIAGMQSQEKSARTQLSLINEEIEAVAKLLEAGHAQRPRLLALQRAAAELEGNRGEFLAMQARANQSIAENDLQILNIKNENLNEVVTALRETQVQIADLEERVRAAEDVFNRIVITAPQAGIVTDLRFHTIGGVIRPGEKIMDIVPQDDQLVIDARVSVQDIDVVHQGLEAQVQLSAFSTRKVPMLEGKVTQVSPDSFIDEATRVPYYMARIKIEDETLEMVNQDDVKLQPGMAANVFIVTGSKSPLSYLFDPITQSFHKAFKEQ